MFHVRSSSGFGDISQNVKGGATLCPPAARGLRCYAKEKVKVRSGHQRSSVGRGRRDTCFMSQFIHIIQKWYSFISDLGHLRQLLGRGQFKSG